MLALLQTFDAVILLGPVSCQDSPQTAQAMCEQVRQRNSATFRLLGEQDSFDTVFLQWERSLRANPAGSGSGGSSRGTSDDKSKAGAGAADYVQSTTVLYRAALQTTLDRDVVRAIQNMDSLTSMRVLGDKLMRDRLSAMTVAFFKYVLTLCMDVNRPCGVCSVGCLCLWFAALTFPSPLFHQLHPLCTRPVDAGISLEVAEMRSAAQERARIAVEQQRMDELKEAVQRDSSR